MKLFGMVLLLFCTFRAVLAQSPINPDSALQRVIDQLEGTPLSLYEAVQNGLEKSTTVRTAEAVYLASRGVVRREKGAFDPSLFFSLEYLDEQVPTASFFAGAPVLNMQQTTGNAGVRLSLPIGTTIEASMNGVQLNSNSAYAFLNPQYTTFGNLELRQPLLGGFTVSARKNLTKAERDMDAAQARYDQEVLGVSSEIERAYWDLYAAERNYAVRKLTRDRADAFLKETKLRAQTGLVGPNQVANARTFLAEQEVLVLESEEQLGVQSDQIAAMIGAWPDSAVRQFITTDNPPELFSPIEVEDLVKEGAQRNLGLQAAKAEINARRALSDAAFWEALPSLDVVGSLGGNGLSGTARDVSFGGDTLRTRVAGDYNDALRQAIQRTYPTWSVGVELTIPIGFRSGLGERDRLDAEVMMAEQLYIERSRTLEEQIRGSCRELLNGQRRLLATREGVAAAQEQVRIGLIEFQNGRSTAFELVRLGQDFASAQQRYSEALVRSAKAAAHLRQLTSGAYVGTTR
jgi:outer membrane protein TolC